jgi:hypothetical protein
MISFIAESKMALVSACFKAGGHSVEKVLKELLQEK